MRQTYERQATFEPPVRRRLVTLTAGIFTLAAISCGYNIAASGLLNVLKANYSWFRQEYGRYEVRQQNKSVVRSRSPFEPQLVGDFFFFRRKIPRLQPGGRFRGCLDFRSVAAKRNRFR